jgi:rubrerythrin
MESLYEHAHEYDMIENETHDIPLAPFACSLCGSRYWPDPHSSCPLCQPRHQEPEEESPL